MLSMDISILSVARTWSPAGCGIGGDSDNSVTWMIWCARQAPAWIDAERSRQRLVALAELMLREIVFRCDFRAKP